MATTMTVASTKVSQVIFDFDNTLYDTERRKEFFWEMANVHGYSMVDAYRMYNQARSFGDKITISLEKYLEILRSNVIQDKRTYHEQKILDIIVEMEKGDNLLPGAKEIVELCQEKKLDCFLLSLGVREWQEMKLQQSGLGAFFSPDHIVFTEDIRQGKKEAVQSLFGGMFEGEGAVLFNDKPEETRELLYLFPQLIALVRREPRDLRYSKKDFIHLQEDFPDRVVWAESLRELMPAFRKLM